MAIDTTDLIDAGARQSGSAATDPSLLCRLRHAPAGPDARRAWEELVARYGPHIHQWCLRWKVQPCDAADITQDVLVRLVRRLPQFVYERKRGSFRAYLKTLVRYAWCDFIDRRDGAFAVGGREELEALGRVDTREDLAQRFGAEFDREILAAAMVRVAARVEARTWEAFRLQAIEGVPAALVGARLTMKIAAVYKARSNVIQLLRRTVQDVEGSDHNQPGP